MRYIALFWASGGSVIGWMICALLTSGKIADLETENQRLREKLSEKAHA